MSNLIELITSWEAFQEGQDKPVKEFCHYYMAQQSMRDPDISQSRQQNMQELLRVMGRIASTFNLYYRAAMNESDLPSAESVSYLSGLKLLNEVRKTELIKYLFVEYTTGMEAISRLIASEYIDERVDPTDKRARLIMLTKEGHRMLDKYNGYLVRASEMIFSQVNEGVIALCLSQLKPIEEYHTQLLTVVRNKGFEEMYDQAINKDAV